MTNNYRPLLQTAYEKHKIVITNPCQGISRVSLLVKERRVDLDNFWGSVFELSFIPEGVWEAPSYCKFMKNDGDSFPPGFGTLNGFTAVDSISLKWLGTSKAFAKAYNHTWDSRINNLQTFLESGAVYDALLNHQNTQEYEVSDVIGGLGLY